MNENELSNVIIGSAIEVHRVLGGPGLLESVYEGAFCHELLLQGLTIQQQVYVDILYKGVKLKSPLKMDLVVNQLVVVEVKATEEFNALHEAQLLTYLRLTGLKLGLLINFGCRHVKEGIIRFVNGLSNSF